MSTEPELSVPEGSGAGLACLLNPIKHHAAAPGTVLLSKPPVAAIPHSLEIVPDKMLPPFAQKMAKIPQTITSVGLWLM